MKTNLDLTSRQSGLLWVAMVLIGMSRSAASADAVPPLDAVKALALERKTLTNEIDKAQREITARLRTTAQNQKACEAAIKKAKQPSDRPQKLISLARTEREQAAKKLAELGAKVKRREEIDGELDKLVGALTSAADAEATKSAAATAAALAAKKAATSAKQQSTVAKRSLPAAALRARQSAAAGQVKAQAASLLESEKTLLVAARKASPGGALFRVGDAIPSCDISMVDWNNFFLNDQVEIVNGTGGRDDGPDDFTYNYYDVDAHYGDLNRDGKREAFVWWDVDMIPNFGGAAGTQQELYGFTTTPDCTLASIGGTSARVVDVEAKIEGSRYTFVGEESYDGKTKTRVAYGILDGKLAPLTGDAAVAPSKPAPSKKK